MHRITQLLLAALVVVFAGAASAEKLVFQGSLSVTFSANLGGGTASATGTGLATVNASSGFEPHLNTLQIEPGLGPQLSTVLPGAGNIVETVMSCQGDVAVSRN